MQKNGRSGDEGLFKDVKVEINGEGKANSVTPQDLVFRPSGSTPFRGNIPGLRRFDRIEYSNKNNSKLALQETSRGIEGFIADGTVFLDINGNRNLDNNETSTTTASDGSFSLTLTQSRVDAVNSSDAQNFLVLEGSSKTKDTATGLSFQTSLLAPSNATVVTPLTTLITQRQQQGQSLEDAEEQVKAAFGVDKSFALTTFDPIQQANDGNPLAPAVFSGGVRVQNAVTQVANFLSGASGQSISDLGNAVFAAIAQQLTQSNFDLNAAPTLETVIQNAATNANLSLSEAQQGAIGEVASIIAAGQQRIANLNTDDPQAFLQEATKVQKVSQGNVANALQGVGQNPKTVSSVAADNTGDSLDNQIATAQTENIAPPQVEDIAFTVSSNLENGNAVGTVPASDIDGDSLEFAITSDNPNTDSDDNVGLAINNEGNLTVADRDDLDFSNTSSLSLTVRATEANRDAEYALADTATVTLNSVPTNNAPEQQFPLQDRASLADGSDLPNWLSFAPESRTFSGTPTESDDGTLNLQVTATDSQGATASSEFSLNIAEVNDDTETDTVTKPVAVSTFNNNDGQLERMAYDTTPANDKDVTTRLSDDLLNLGTDAEFDNLVGFYEIQDTNGGIETNGDGTVDLLPGDEGYAKAAITNRVTNWELRGGSFWRSREKYYCRAIWRCRRSKRKTLCSFCCC
ncbi:MAG: hypothetical protein BRC51_10955 [Cyanobacteria bacterium SW_12_48_29]|nr:MAG: hypothetical protein BRC51_10955 [Cyanobacteria bacterium SW_12_48_29]